MSEATNTTPETKVCTMCGEDKLLDEFRLYPNGKKRYPYCKDCQTIENRRRYLVGLPTLSVEQMGELNTINELYDKRIECGLNTFSRTKSVTALELAKQQLDKLA